MQLVYHVLPVIKVTYICFKLFKRKTRTLSLPEARIISSVVTRGNVLLKWMKHVNIRTRERSCLQLA